MSSAPPFLVRHRASAALGALGAAALLMGAHVYRWHWPHRLEGIAGEWPLAAVSLAAAAVAWIALPRLEPRLAAARAAVAGIAGAIALAAALAADPFAGARNWRYAPESCDFAVEFPSRPALVHGQPRLAGMQMKTVTRAIFTDVGTALTFSAECLDFERAVSEAEKPAVLDATEAQLRAAAARLRITVERVERAAPDTIVLSGFSDEGRNERNEPLVRRAEARARLGRASLLILWAWTVGRGEVRLPDSAAVYFASARPAPH